MRHLGFDLAQLLERLERQHDVVPAVAGRDALGEFVELGRGLLLAGLPEIVGRRGGARRAEGGGFARDRNRAADMRRPEIKLLDQRADLVFRRDLGPSACRHSSACWGEPALGTVTASVSRSEGQRTALPTNRKARSRLRSAMSARRSSRRAISRST